MDRTLKSAAAVAGTILLAAALVAGCGRSTGTEAPGAPAADQPAAAATASAASKAADRQVQATATATAQATTLADSPIPTAAAPATPDPLTGALSDLDSLLKSINGALSGSDAGGE